MRLSIAALRIGRGTGIGGGIVAIALWGSFAAAGGSITLTAAMGGLALLAIGSAWFGRPLGLLVAFVMSFVPVGLYLLGTPSIYAGIGLANLLYLAAAVLVFLARRRLPPPGPE